MTDTKRPLKVFLCHAHADRDAVKALYTRLTQDGVDYYALQGTRGSTRKNLVVSRAAPSSSVRVSTLPSVAPDRLGIGDM